jgi:hypothetical protein
MHRTGTWTIWGYIMGSLTLGYWGGIVSQLLVDFRITAMPEGAAATAGYTRLSAGG